MRFLSRIAQILLPQGMRPKPQRQDKETSQDKYLRLFRERTCALEARPLPDSASGPSFSLLTSVYERTPINFFLEAADSIQQQTYTNYEWIVLRHGPIPDELADILDNMSEAGRIRLLNLEVNLGSAGGIQYCFQHASNEYIIPMDADDVLVPSALAAAADHILRFDHPDFLYSDEDFIEDGKLFDPYFRPEWDPVLCLAGSYIYHLEIFKREVAIELGVYSNSVSGLCHDWDTVLRFYTAGKHIRHIPELLYHWRRHTNSISNAEVKDVHQDSQPAALGDALRHMGQSGNFDIEEFPIFRGATEYRYRWKHSWPVTMHMISVLQDANVGLKENAIRKFTKATNIPDGNVHILPAPCPSATPGAGIEDLASLLDKLPDSEWVTIMDARLQPNPQWFLEEVAGWFTLVNQLDFISGPILTPENIILEGGMIFGYGGAIIGSPEAGRHGSESGPFSICLRPHCVDAPHSCFFVARIKALKAAIAAMPPGVQFRALGAWLGAWAARQNRLVAWSPLLRTQTLTPFSTEMMDLDVNKQPFTDVHIDLLSESRWYSKHLYAAPGLGWIAPGM